MKQYARQKCQCGALALVTPTDSPYEFDVSCALCGRSRKISWARNQKPPEFVTNGASKFTKPVQTPRGRKPGHKMPLPDVIGRSFGDLEVLEFAGMKGNRRLWLCKCLSTMRTGRKCGNTRVVETKVLNHIGGRRCSECNKHLLQKRAAEASTWMYKNRKTATAKG